MKEIKLVDARGLSCPEPVLMTQNAIKGLARGPVAVLVDTVTSRNNVSRIAERFGWRVRVEDQPDGSYRLVLDK
ncbi:MAG: hypothetical protein AUK03_04760 [Anaerolineae bacterium CG2_30_64_16]|nr:MAG: hypothetical protein AUK03_04760 [Anaerolineae bacterium CG2_30_64_16]